MRRIRSAHNITTSVSALLLSACASLASDSKPGPVAERLDRWQQSVYRSAQSAAERLDKRFAGKNVEALPYDPTPFRLGLESALIDRSDGVDVQGLVSLDASLSLPNIEKRLRLFITTVDLTEAPELNDREQNRLRIGARYAFLDDLDFDVGVRAEIWPVAFTSLRWSQLHQRGHLRWSPFVKTYLESGDGFGVATGFTIDHLSEQWLLRSSSYYDWQSRPDAASWTQAFVVARVRTIIPTPRARSLARLDDIGEGWALRLAVSSPGAADSQVGSYAATLLMKRHLHGKWLYGYFGPELRFDREYDWNPDYGIRLGISALFEAAP